jgi:Ca2+-transporting ATPase
MPMNIPLLTTIILVTGVLAMARRNVVVRDLNSVETFSRVSVACTDKTGTLTKGEMTVRWLCFPSLERVYGVTGVGLDPRGNIVEAEPSIVSEKSAGTTPEDLPKSAKLEADSPLWYMVVSGFMNNTSLRVEVPGPKGKIHKWLGNLTDVALAVLFAKSGLDEGNCKSRFSELRSFSFDSKLKRMTRVYKDNRSGEYIAFTKGATELLLPLCTWTAMDSFEKVMPLDEKTISKIVEWTDSFASRGHRVVSFCYKKNLDLAGLGESRETVETNLAYLGFVAILDPPRVGVRESVSDALRAGVRPVMVTGDNSETARSIAQEVGISQTPSDQIITGVDLQSSSDDEFLRAPVFARVSPEDKLLIVRRYQKLGRPLSMTGDGVNDALAISAADIGVAMGQTGTDVAKQAADIVLADDSFSSVVQGIRVGRGTFQKIRSIIFFYIAVNFAEALVYFGSGFIPQFSLLNSWQHIFVFITAHSLPPFAIIADYLNKDVMREKPKETEGIFTRRLLVALMIFAISMAGLLYLGYFGTLFDILGGVSPENKLGYAPSFNPSNLIGVSSWEQAKARTLLIAVALISESLLVISLRRINKTIPQMLREEPWWPAFPLVTLPPLALLALVYFPSIQTFLLNSLGMNFELIRLSFGDWGLILLLSIIPVLFVELYKLYLRERGKQF